MGKLINKLFFCCFVFFNLEDASSNTLRIATPLLAQDADNPYQALSLPSSISSQVMFDPMVIIDRNGIVQPWLVTDWKSLDSKTWTLTIRSNVKFSNGVPLHAEAVSESVSHMQTPKGRTETVGSSLANIDRAVAISSEKVELILKKPDPMFPWRLAIWRLPEPVSWKIRREDPSRPPAGNTGPFSMVEKKAGRSIYIKNSNAWNSPHVERLDLIHVPDQTARLQAIIADGVDIGLQMGIGDGQILNSVDGSLFKRLTARVTYLSFAKEHYPKKSPVHDKNVRLAVNYAIDRERISRLLLDSYAVPTGQLSLRGSPGFVESVKAFPYDPEKARSLLKDAGYTEGVELSIRIAASGSDDMLVYQQIAEDMRNAGIQINLLGAGVGQMTQMLFSGDFNAEMFSNFGRGLDPLGDYRYRSCLGQTGNYPPYFCDPVSLELVRQAQIAQTLEEVDSLMSQVTLQEQENPPGVILWQGVTLDGFSGKIISAENYGNYYDFIPYHSIKVE